MNEQELQQTMDELRKLTQQRDELNQQIVKLKTKILMKKIKEQIDGEH